MFVLGLRIIYSANVTKYGLKYHSCYGDHMIYIPAYLPLLVHGFMPTSDWYMCMIYTCNSAYTLYQ